MATISTRINSSGTYLVNGTFDEITYNRTSPVIKNLLIYTEDFSGWAASGGNIVTTNQSIAPDGSLTADRIQATTGDYTAILNNSSVGGASYTFSFWVKSVSGATGTWGVNYYDGAHNRTTVPITGEWTRQYITFTGTGGQFNVYIADNRSSLATITDAYVWGAQLERGTTPTIYQGITASGTLITPTFKNKVTSDAVYVTDIFDEVTFNPLTRGLYIGNSLSYSQDMSQTSVWNYSSGGSGVPPVVTPNAALAPDGTLTANRVFFNSGPVTGTGQSSLNQGNAVPLTTGTSQTFSVWMRVETTATGVNMFNGDNINSILLDTNWTRYSLPITYSSPVAYGVRIAKREIWGTGGAANVLIWGAQLNPGLTATVHVPTGANATPISIAVKKETSDGAVYVTGSFDEFTGTASVVDGLVAYYDPAYSLSYPGSGANLYNLVDGIAATLNGTYSASTAAVGTSVSGMQTIRLTNSDLISAPNNISYVQAPSFTNVTTVSIWFYQHTYNGISRYILDGRSGGSGGWIYNGSIGTNWSTGIVYVNGSASSGTPAWSNWGGDATGVWKNVTFIANTPFTDDINVFSRFSDNEGLDVTFGPILIYNRVLTQVENALNFNALRNRYGI